MFDGVQRNVLPRIDLSRLYFFGSSTPSQNFNLLRTHPLLGLGTVSTRTNKNLMPFFFYRAPKTTPENRP